MKRTFLTLLVLASTPVFAKGARLLDAERTELKAQISLRTEERPTFASMRGLLIGGGACILGGGLLGLGAGLLWGTTFSNASGPTASARIASFVFGMVTMGVGIVAGVTGLILMLIGGIVGIVTWRTQVAADQEIEALESRLQAAAPLAVSGGWALARF